jgi:hypothetical protein
MSEELRPPEDDATRGTPPAAGEPRPAEAPPIGSSHLVQFVAGGAIGLIGTAVAAFVVSLAAFSWGDRMAGAWVLLCGVAGLLGAWSVWRRVRGRSARAAFNSGIVVGACAVLLLMSVCGGMVWYR